MRLFADYRHHCVVLAGSQGHIRMAHSTAIHRERKIDELHP
nr:hypothetical protein [Pararhizobium sp. IMCC3301]